MKKGLDIDLFNLEWIQIDPAAPIPPPTHIVTTPYCSITTTKFTHLNVQLV